MLQSERRSRDQPTGERGSRTEGPPSTGLRWRQGASGRVRLAPLSWPSRAQHTVGYKWLLPDTATRARYCMRGVDLQFRRLRLPFFFFFLRSDILIFGKTVSLSNNSVKTTCRVANQRPRQSIQQLAHGQEG